METVLGDAVEHAAGSWFAPRIDEGEIPVGRRLFEGPIGEGHP